MIENLNQGKLSSPYPKFQNAHKMQDWTFTPNDMSKLVARESSHQTTNILFTISMLEKRKSSIIHELGLLEKRDQLLINALSFLGDLQI